MKVERKLYMNFFTADALNDSASSGESVSSPFSLKISIGLKEFPCTECPHVSFFSSVRTLLHDYVPTLWMNHDISFTVVRVFVSWQKNITAHCQGVDPVWTFWIFCSFFAIPRALGIVANRQ